MNDAEPLKEYFPQSPQSKAKTSLLLLLLKLARYNQVGDLGIAGVLIFQSRKGKFLHFRRL